MKYPKDFLEACRKVGRDPKTIKDPEGYMRGWYRAGKQMKDRSKKGENTNSE